VDADAGMVVDVQAALRLCDAFSVGGFIGVTNRRRLPQQRRALPPAILCKPFGFYRRT
jgi:hypothetical protein